MKKVVLTVFKRNAAALEFYRHIGYVAIYIASALLNAGIQQGLQLIKRHRIMDQNLAKTLFRMKLIIQSCQRLSDYIL